VVTWAYEKNAWGIYFYDREGPRLAGVAWGYEKKA
jgi:hypothetical protein